MYSEVVLVLLLPALACSDRAAGDGRAVWNATLTDRLKHDLLLKYDKFARPAEQYNSTHVKLDLVITHLQVDEEKSVLIVNGWTKFVWTDDKLKWNASDYGGQNRLHLADHEIWQPDVVLYNSVQGNDIDHYGNTYCLLYSNGLVLWVPPSQFFLNCHINLRRWPYDTHTCVMKFGSWTYSVEEIDLNIDEKEDESHMMLSEWEIISKKKNRTLMHYTCCVEAYPSVDFEFTFRRRSHAYTSLVFAPALVCVLLTLSVFWLPPTAGEKFLLSGVTSVIITLLMIYFTQRLPVMTVDMPIIVEFYIYNLVLVCVSLLTSVLAVNLGRSPKARPLPAVLNQLLTSRAGKLLHLSHIKTQSRCAGQDSEELHERSLVSDPDTKTNQTNTAHDWVVLATAIDRIMFVVYVLVFSTLSFILLFT